MFKNKKHCSKVFFCVTVSHFCQIIMLLLRIFPFLLYHSAETCVFMTVNQGLVESLVLELSLR